MCTRYISPDQQDIERFWEIGRRKAPVIWDRAVFPRRPAPFIRLGSEGPELVVGQWGLVPFFAQSPILKYATQNARIEGVVKTASYRQPWAQGQRCIIPAESFDEPCWETGKNVWWTFRRADGNPWGLAGLWSTWVDRETGEVVESYSMLTQNADANPIMRRMHKPDPKLGPHQQDKRSVVAIECGDVERWLTGSIEDALELIRLTPAEEMVAEPN